MRSRRYTVLIADRSSGVVRRVTIGLRTATTVVAAVLVMPVLIGLGARWEAHSELGQLRVQNSALKIENGNYRATTGELTTQIQSLENVIDDLGARAALVQHLPAVVKAKAAGGSAQPNATISSLFSSLTNPEDTFGVLRDLLRSIESRLSYVRRDVERQEKLAAATPSIWPAIGWQTGRFGERADPFTGESSFHQGLDISTSKGQPVIATADGTVDSASYTGDYGNLVVLRHDFGLATRYGHLSSYNVTPGTPVKRGDIIGYVGSTGRSTGAHLHYEILLNGQLINPLQLLTQPDNR